MLDSFRHKRVCIPIIVLHNSKIMSRIRSNEFDTSKNLSSEWVGCLETADECNPSYKIRIITLQDK